MNKKIEFELFLHKIYINIIFCTKYSNEHLDVVIKEYISHSKHHSFYLSLGIFKVLIFF